MASKSDLSRSCFVRSSMCSHKPNHGDGASINPTGSVVWNAYVRFHSDSHVLSFRTYELASGGAVRICASENERGMWRKRAATKEKVQTLSSYCRSCSSNARNSVFLLLRVSSRRCSSLSIDAFFSWMTRSSFSISCSRFFERSSSLFSKRSWCSLVNLIRRQRYRSNQLSPFVSYFGSRNTLETSCTPFAADIDANWTVRQGKNCIWHGIDISLWSSW